MFERVQRLRRRGICVGGSVIMAYIFISIANGENCLIIFTVKYKDVAAITTVIRGHFSGQRTLFADHREFHDKFSRESSLRVHCSL